MSKKPVLVVMAAGMGSRYGGLKQIDPVGSQGEAILDYSLFDAHEAGFETAVIIIKEAIREDFMATVGKRLEKCPLEIRYAYQEQTKMLPEGFTVPEIRGAKPWGTGHAVLCAAKEIDGAPFAVVNVTTTTASPHTRPFSMRCPMPRTVRRPTGVWLAISWATPSPTTAAWPGVCATSTRMAI